MSTKTDPKQQADLAKSWMSRINDALAREKDYRTAGRKIVATYEAKKGHETPFAILYSNTEVLQPALYNQKPVPIVQRRFKDADPVGKCVSEVSTRMLKFLLDTEAATYDSFDDVMQPAVLDGCLTNRGLTRFKFVAEGQTECVFGETVRWDKFFHGYARTWKKVPWIGFEWDMSSEEVKENFPDAKIEWSKLASTSSEDPDNSETKQELTGVKTYVVYEIWDKTSRKVLFFMPGADVPLRQADDPLGLSGFFPVPRPLNFTRKTSTLIPTPLYEYYKQQAAELNDITGRLKAIIKAIKYRGAYNSTVEGIDKMLSADDNELVAVDNIASMPDGSQAIDRLIYVVPVNELVQTAQTLYQARESCKQVIYEITGISDILRGASVASETATAQNIKNQWGSLRLKKMQKEVQRYCRESLAIILEIAAAKFEQKTVAAMTGLPYLTNAQKAQMQQKIQEAQQQAQMAAQMQQSQPQMPGQPPQQPPQPPQIPPEIQHLLALPSWEDILGVLQNDVTRHYKTDIETNSTIDAEAAQDKQDIADLLNALSQFLNGLGPMIESGVMPFAIAKEMLLVITRRYNFGTNLEDILNEVQEPPKKDGDPAAEAKAQAAQADAAASKAESEQKMKLTQAETQGKLAIMAKEMELAQQQIQLKQLELQMQERALNMKNEFAMSQHSMKMQQLKAKPAPAAGGAND